MSIFSHVGIKPISSLDFQWFKNRSDTIDKAIKNVGAIESHGSKKSEKMQSGCEEYQDLKQLVRPTR